MVHFIERLAEIQVNDVSVRVSGQVFENVIDVVEELGQAVSPGSETVLVQGEKLVTLNVGDSLLPDNPLKDFDQVRNVRETGR